MVVVAVAAVLLLLLLPEVVRTGIQGSVVLHSAGGCRENSTEWLKLRIDATEL